MLDEINYVTKTLQTKNYTLRKCRNDLNMLMEAVAEENSDPSSNSYQCKLGKTYIAPKSTIMKYSEFESAVVKLQKGLCEDLIRGEKA